MKVEELLKFLQDVHEVFPISDLPEDFKGTHGMHIDRSNGMLTLHVWVPDPSREDPIVGIPVWFDMEDELNINTLRDVKLAIAKQLEDTLEELQTEVEKGIAQMDAGLGIPADEMRDRIEKRRLERSLEDAEKSGYIGTEATEKFFRNELADEEYYKENAESLKDDAWTAITTEAAKHIFVEGSLLDRMGGMPPTVKLDKYASSGIHREPTPRQFDRVELVEDIDDLPRGSQGTIVDVYVTNNQVGYYVEFPQIEKCYMLDLSQIKVVESER